LAYTFKVACELLQSQKDEILAAISNKGRTAVADWEGVLVLFFDECKSLKVSEKRQEGQGDDESIFYFDFATEGPYASTALDAAVRYFSENTTLETSGTVGTLNIPVVDGRPAIARGAVAGIVIGTVAGIAIVVIAFSILFSKNDKEGYERS